MALTPVPPGLPPSSPFLLPPSTSPLFPQDTQTQPAEKGAPLPDFPQEGQSVSQPQKVHMPLTPHLDELSPVNSVSGVYPTCLAPITAP